jgi:hypothetical protein
MELLELSKWSVWTEPDLTREAYALMDSGGAERCGCEACFNFLNSRHLVYSAEVLDFFEWLGIDPLLEAEVHRDGCLGENQHRYTVAFFLVGRIASGPLTTTAISVLGSGPSLEEADGDVRVGFNADTSDAPDVFLGLPAVCLEVELTVPWISNAPEPVI